MANTKTNYSTEQECLNDLVSGSLITFQDNTKRLRSYVFYQNTNIKHLKFPEVIELGSYGCFSGCTNLEDIQFGKKVDFYINDNSYYSYPSHFANTPNLAHLILKGSTKSTISGDSNRYDRVLIGSAIYYKNGAIYVPEQLLQEYQNDTYWGQYFIVPIQDTLLTTFDTIKDDWATIVRNCNVNNISHYKIGDSKVFHDINGNAFYAELVGKNVDTIAGTSRTAPTTWITRQLYPSSRAFSSSPQNWENSTIRADINDEDIGILSIIDENALRNNIKQVSKTSWDGTTEITTSDKIWLPSIREIYGSDQYEKTGPKYSDFFLKHRFNRIKYITLSGYTNVTQGNTYSYWSRTNYGSSSNTLYTISTSGAISNMSYSGKLPYCFGFCI